MESTVRILKRFIHATVLISLFLLLLNFMVLLLWIGNGISADESPSFVVQKVAKGLDGGPNHYILDPLSQKLLEEQQIWAMLIANTGKVAWEFKLPDEIERTYSLTDVAKFSRNYLMDYPVFVYEHQDGLVVVGYPKGSLAKYQHILQVGWVESLPLRAVLFLIGNIVLALLLSLLIGSKLIHSIRPLTHGIHALADDREVKIEPKGILADLATSINHASLLLQKKTQSLNSRDEARSNWIAGISHDIRTPLSMVLGYASEIAESEDAPSEHRRLAGIIRKQAEHLRSLVHDLNLVSMLEYEMQPIGMKQIRLSALARQAASDFLNNGVDERFTLEVDVADEGSRINGDERLLLRAIANLLQNCIRHNPEGCQIRLHTSHDPDKQLCRIVVSDDGKGIAQEELTDLLELPYSVRRKRPRHNGHGLGLPMAARIAKAHGGRLSLSGGVGEGFCATIELPAVKPHG
ncbi:sensor histidine kinase [Brevibacillus panacihumi]|uniref:histidine kinase n=1 Tax=Brevibacillus panacihumi TaxID=497735 RepID=A0A3M8CPJ0_9BACL|nr:HAMP domain-containing sensor histidine kinase [Brevibacillus panacihumi]RNB77479.1 sensor histidine kinase [Brevibacillus panacihumi]